MGKATVQDIVVERLIEKIETENIMPWQKPFQSACMNWFSNHEYRGINRFLLSGGEYITKNQLETYNEKNGTRFWFEKGTPSDIVTFYSQIKKKISNAELEEIRKKNPNWARFVQPTPEGWVRISWVLRYYKVYNIKYIRDIVNPDIKNKPEYKDGVYEKREIQTKTGVRYALVLKGGKPVLKEGIKPEDIVLLEPKLGKIIFEEHTPAEEIVDKYLKASGVKLDENSVDGAAYSELFDTVRTPPRNYFKSSEDFYRVVFHELTHSTGIESRLNRDCFKKYHDAKIIRSKEELIAEVGALLLATEAGFREEGNHRVENSLNYVAGWVSWMKENKTELLNGLLAAEKAVDYILTGGESANAGSSRSIDNPKESTEDSNIDTEQGEENVETNEKEIPSNEGVNSSSKKEDKLKKKSKSIQDLKTKTEVRKFISKHLSSYFAEETTEEEKLSLLKKIKGEDIKHLYKILSDEEMPKVRNKALAMELLGKQLQEATITR